MSTLLRALFKFCPYDKIYIYNVKRKIICQIKLTCFTIRIDSSELIYDTKMQFTNDKGIFVTFLNRFSYSISVIIIGFRNLN